MIEGRDSGRGGIVDPGVCGGGVSDGRRDVDITRMTQDKTEPRRYQGRMSPVTAQPKSAAVRTRVPVARQFQANAQVYLPGPHAIAHVHVASLRP